MRKKKVNSSFNNKSVNILNIEFDDEEKINNNSTIKNSFNNSKIIKNYKINSSEKNINITNNKNTSIEAIKINSLFNIKNSKNQKIKEKNKILINKKQKIIFENNDIKKSDIEFNHSEYKDKSDKNWDEVKTGLIQHIENEQILKKIDKENLNKKYFNQKRNFFFGRHKVSNLPYVYDISSTYMNNYYNKSEHKRHETLIDELCKLRSYLQKDQKNNDIDIIRDFLLKNNIQNLDKYNNYDLLQLGKFVCQDDIYKINSLLKPYLHVKDMIYDILENSMTLNNKFSGYKFNTSIDKLLNKICLEKNKNNKKDKNKMFNKNDTNSYFKNIKNSAILDKKTKNNKTNKKFYISELDYSMNSNDNNNSFINIKNNIIEDINNNEDNEDEKCEEIKNKNHREFISYSKRRKELLDNIGIFIQKKPNQNNDNKDLYTSPLFQKNKKQNRYIKNNNINLPKKNRNYLELPKINNNKMISYYKPNKLLLAPDKNYSSNFNLLLKDINNELKHFENLYHQKLELIGSRNASHNNSMIFNSQKTGKNLKPLNHCQSCKLFESCDMEKIKKMEAVNRLYYGKKSIKIDLNDIQKKHKLTEYIALANAKTHIKNDLLNENVLK